PTYIKTTFIKHYLAHVATDGDRVSRLPVVNYRTIDRDETHIDTIITEITENVKIPEEPDFGGLTFGAATGVRLRTIGPLTRGNGDGVGGIAGGAGLELLKQAAEGEAIAALELVTATDRTPSMPWHRMEEPAVHMFGLMSFTLLR
ncbi:hypothetical protein PanWU01x14_026920, partial [Parasponia andersonii]